MSYSIRCPATTVDEIVKRVNIPKGTFYLFYKSKELLLFEVI
ncbi:TetR/AcrR family transcriptional regulator [Parablautia intestinalis]|nr:TetR/AcrR family transcriptional regulator [Parablautia intestinalis]